MPGVEAEPATLVAGSDTREANATQTVRASALAAALIAAPAWAAAFGASAAWTAHLNFAKGGRAWFAAALVAAGVAASLVARRTPIGPTDGLPAGVRVSGTIVLLGVMVAVTGDAELGALALPIGAVLGGWVVGRCAQLAVAATVPAVAPAAEGLVVTGALLGVIPAGHIGLVAAGSGLPRAAGWGAAYAALGTLSLLRAGRHLARDSARAARTSRPVARTEGSETATALLVEGVTVTFGTTPLLRSVSLTASAGELVALAGANGAGKSTLLRVASGFLTPESGRVVVAGEDVTGLRPEERAAAGLVFVSGARPIFPDLTVQQNLRVAAFRTHRTGRSFAAATDAVFDLVPALVGRRDTRAGVLSGGEQRLLAIAQTLYRMPVALLADELALGLDADARSAVLGLLRLLADDGVAVVAVDHDLPGLLPRADKAALLVDGTVTEHLAPTELLKHAALLPAIFLADAVGPRA